MGCNRKLAEDRKVSKRGTGLLPNYFFTNAVFAIRLQATDRRQRLEISLIIVARNAPHVSRSHRKKLGCFDFDEHAVRAAR